MSPTWNHQFPRFERRHVWSLAAVVALVALAGCEKDQPAPALPGSITPEGATASGSSAAAPGTTSAAAADTAATAEPTGSSSATAAASGQPSATAAVGGTPTATASAKPTKGQEKATGAYSAWLQALGKYQVGKQGVVQAVLVAKGDYKCNEKYPYKFKLAAAPGGVTYPSTTVTGISYGKSRSALNIPFVASAAGTYTISGKFYFSVCTAERCKVQKQVLSVSVEVE